MYVRGVTDENEGFLGERVYYCMEAKRDLFVR